MFTESFTTTILFRLINLTALIGLFAYIFKKYMQHDIEESIEHDRQEEVNLHTRISEVEDRGTELSKEIIEQEKLCAHLIACADKWKISFEKEVQEKQCELQALQKHIAERTKRQTQAIAYEQVMQAVLPKAVAEARKQLESTFNQKTKSKEFIENIIARIKKSI